MSDLKKVLAEVAAIIHIVVFVLSLIERSFTSTDSN